MHTLQALRSATPAGKTVPPEQSRLVVLRRFVVFIVGADLVWEIAHQETLDLF